VWGAVKSEGNAALRAIGPFNYAYKAIARDAEDDEDKHRATESVKRLECGSAEHG
jgi:hypothetical protein